MLFDSHAHINNYDMTPQMVAELAALIEASELDYVTDIGYDLESSEVAAQNAAPQPQAPAKAPDGMKKTLPDPERKRRKA